MRKRKRNCILFSSVLTEPICWPVSTIAESRSALILNVFYVGGFGWKLSLDIEYKLKAIKNQFEFSFSITNNYVWHFYELLKGLHFIVLILIIFLFFRFFPYLFLSNCCFVLLWRYIVCSHGFICFCLYQIKYKYMFMYIKKEPIDAPAAVRGCADSADICCTKICTVLDE